MTELVDRSEEERKQALRRERRRAAKRDYHKRPEVRARKREYEKRPEVRARERDYHKRPEVRARKREYEKRPEVRARKREYDVKEENKARARERELLANFGITVVQYDLMFKQQGGVCVMCGHPPKKLRLAVEHDHKTGRVRGLACHRCNKYRIGTNTIETARKLVAYLESDFDGRKLVA